MRLQVRETVRRAISSFLAIPTLVILFFVLLAAIADAIDRASFLWLNPMRSFMQRHVFADAQATSNLLGTIAGGMITVTSITFSLLLLALQQSTSSLTHEVLDQFLRRKITQLYFGFFVGLTLYTLIILATVNPPFNPVFGATLAVILTAFALYLLLILIYSTISQMRPTEIIRSIHNHALLARKRQLTLLIERTRRAPSHPDDAPSARVFASNNGYVVGFDLDGMHRAITAESERIEVLLHISVGSYVAFGDLLADVFAGSVDQAEKIARIVPDRIQIERNRQIESDPAYCIDQLETIAWRSISTSQQNPAPGLSVIRNLRDILARWAEQPTNSADAAASRSEPLPIVYVDNVMTRLLNTFVLLAVVASSAKQPQSCAEVLRTFAITFARLPRQEQAQLEDLTLRIISTLSDQVLTVELGEAMHALAVALEEGGYANTAASLRLAHAELASTIGHLNSRAH